MSFKETNTRDAFPRRNKAVNVTIQLQIVRMLSWLTRTCSAVVSVSKHPLRLYLNKLPRFDSGTASYLEEEDT